MKIKAWKNSSDIQAIKEQPEEESLAEVNQLGDLNDQSVESEINEKKDKKIRSKDSNWKRLELFKNIREKTKQDQQELKDNVNPIMLKL